MLARFGSLWLAGLLCLGALPTTAQEEPGAGAFAVFRLLEQAWARGDASGLVEHVGSTKVRLAMPALEGGSGLFSRSQLELLFAQHFANNETLSFQFKEMRPPAGRPPVAVALAQRRLRALGAGTVRQDRVLVTLALEGDRWILSEITVVR